MSAIDSISTSTPPSSAGGLRGLDNEEFLRIIFSELTNQDPLAPNDTKEILQQVSAIRQIESDIALTDHLQELVAQNSLASAGALIGKYISGRTDSGQTVEDFVVSVKVTREGPLLNLLSGYQIPLDNLDEIVDPAAFGPLAPTS